MRFLNRGPTELSRDGQDCRDAIVHTAVSSTCVKEFFYVQGFLNGGGYEAIPLEVNAYTLEDRFRREPHRAFSVEQEVAKLASEGRL